MVSFLNLKKKSYFYLNAFNNKEIEFLKFSAPLEKTHQDMSLWNSHQGIPTNPLQCSFYLQSLFAAQTFNLGEPCLESTISSAAVEATANICRVAWYIHVRLEYYYHKDR